MNFLFLLSIFFTFCGVFSVKKEGETWAVLIAGSDKWQNYRHQSDICHTYQMLHANGIPDERIITFMVDDIAYNPSNPLQGYIRNVLGGGNVYENVLKDYTGDNVNKENIFAVLRGEDMSGIGSEKTLKSGPNDDVLIVFDDHGGQGTLGLPHELIHAQEMLEVLADMEGRYRTIAFYLNACHSGSMFDGILPTNTSIIALTAANPKESGFAVDYDKEIKAYLSSDFAKNWVVDTETAVEEGTIGKKTFYQQYYDVAVLTHQRSPRQHVCWYGDESLANVTIKTWHTNGQFQKPGVFNHKENKKNQKSVSNGEMTLHMIYRQLAEDPNNKELTNELLELLELKEKSEAFWNKFNTKFNLQKFVQNEEEDGCHQKNPIDPKCQMTIINNYISQCGNFNDFDLLSGTYSLHLYCQSKGSLSIADKFFAKYC